jgi:hypothetical protein
MKSRNSYFRKFLRQIKEKEFIIFDGLTARRTGGHPKETF